MNTHFESFPQRHEAAELTFVDLALPVVGYWVMGLLECQKSWAVHFSIGKDHAFVGGCDPPSLFFIRNVAHYLPTVLTHGGLVVLGL